MRSTLFYIPHEILGVPLLGLGWLLLFLAIGFVIWALIQSRAGRLASELPSGLPVWLIAAAIVYFVLPNVETNWPDGTPIGLPVRGYGVMVLLGLFAGIGLTNWRGKQVGISPEVIISLGFWMMVGGVIGARAFFVIQYWDEFARFPAGERWIAVLKLTEGGLVIYGGMIGGAVAGAIFCWKNRLPALAFGDLIAPGFLIGSAFGRIGCLLNGCCFGGVCDANLPTVQFPQGSPPYVAQLESGRLIGVHASPSSTRGELTIDSVEPGSLAEQGWQAKPGMSLSIDHRASPPIRGVDDPARTPALSASVQIDNRAKILANTSLPAWSLPVHPSQIYSAIDSFLLCCLIVCLQPWVWRDGQAFFTAVGLHGIARFTLELIRSDEMGKFGTSLTIAQWISLCGVALAVVAWVITARLPAKRAWRWHSCSPLRGE